MSSCVDLIQGLNPSCEALNKAGGVNKRVWIGQLSQLTPATPYTDDVDGYITALSLITTSPVQKLHKFIGKTYKNNGSYELQVGENVNTFNHSATLLLYHFTPEDRKAIEQLANADDLFVIFETEAGQVEVFGIEKGLNASAGSGGTGTNLNDTTAYTITVSGQQLNMPKLMKVTDLAGTITYLDGISV
jgi:hypothetical protein